MTTGYLRRWAMGLALVGFMFYVPFLYYRFTLEHSKRLRPIVPGQVYRSGCMSADGFRDAIDKLKIKTVITLWDEDPDPLLRNSRFDSTSVKESELCKSLGVDYRFVYVQLLPDQRIGKDRLTAIDEFLKIMDDEKSYPVLFHCKAGLHRTGVMAAIYRMEYNGWSREDALRELRAHGFGYWTGNVSNDYIAQYVMPYRPRSQRGDPGKLIPPAAKSVPGTITLLSDAPQEGSINCPMPSGAKSPSCAAQAQLVSGGVGPGTISLPSDRTQVYFPKPAGMKIFWFTQGAESKANYSTAPLETPSRQNFAQACIYRLKLTHIPEHPDLEIYPTLEVISTNAKTSEFLAHNCVPVEFSQEEIKQVLDRNYFVKVIYLPDPQFQDGACACPQEIVSTQLEPGMDPIQEAQRRGSILLVLRVGNVDQGSQPRP